MNNKNKKSNKGIKNSKNVQVTHSIKNFNTANTTENLEKLNANNKSNKINTINRRKVIAVLLILLILLSFAIYKIIMLIMNPTDTFMVEEGSIYQEEDTIGYIIRDEEIVKGKNYKNGMEQIKSEGEKVAKNKPIYRYYSLGEEELEKKISDLDKKIDEAIQNDDSQIPNGDISSLEQQITEKLDGLYQETDLKKIKEYKKDVDEYINKKSRIVGEYSPSGSYLKKLIDERSKYENELNNGVEYVNAPTSGIVSYKIDGYEDILTPDSFSTINKELLEGINIKTGQIVATSEESGKIISDFNFYIACILSSESSKSAEVGDQVKIRFYNGKEIPAEIDYISEEDDDRIIIFKVNQDVQDLISYRKISLDIIWWSDSGKKIPNESIAREQKGENEVPYVIRTRDGYSDKIYVKILRANDKYSIVTNYTKDELKELGFTTDEIKSTKSLTIYDEILKKPI